MAGKKSSSRGSGSAAGAWARRIVGLAILGGAAWFAVQGGEYSTFDLLRQQKRESKVRHDVAALQHEVDSLSIWKKQIETDPVVQERIAREEFGMLRGNKELLYRFAEPRDSTHR